jgi:uncharacterized protein (DUF1499 family)
MICPAFIVTVEVTMRPTEWLAEGRIEATATTRWFGFKDDVVIRIAPSAGNGSRVDIRSVSRVGLSDVGTNTRRIRAFLKKFAEASKTGG